MAQPLSELLTPRWRTIVCAGLVGVAGWIAFEYVAANSPHRAAKRYFRDSFVAGATNERMASELDRMSPAVAVAALAELIDEQNSRRADWCETIYNKAPAQLRSRLRRPLDRSRVTSRCIEALGRFGADAASAVPALIRLHERASPGMDLRMPTATALGRIGPPASNAIPVLLPDLNPTNRSFTYAIPGVLVRLDPTGDQTDRALRQRMRAPRCERLAAEIAEKCAASLSVGEGPAYGALRDQWSAAQALGLIRPEALRIVPVLIPLLDNQEERLRSIAAESLGRLGPAAANALPKLQLLLNDDWAMVREAATNAIRGIDRPLPQ